MNDHEWQEVRDIFEKRGVSREVAEARPYVPYRRGDAWVYDDGGPFAVVPKEQRSVTVTRDVRGADGLIMHKNPVPLKNRKLSEFPPQLRPTPVEFPDGTRSIKVHDHADPWLARRDVRDHVLHDHDGVDVEGLHDNYRPETHSHADMVESARDDHVAGKRHRGVDTDDVHSKGEDGKYKLPPVPLIDDREPHVHPRPVRVEYTDRRGTKRVTVYCRHRPECASDLEHTVRHIAKFDHVTMDRDTRLGMRNMLRVFSVADVVERYGSKFPPDGEPHFHTYRDKDHETDSYSKRYDVHPLGVPLLKSTRAAGGIVYISGEGNLKGDAILSDILRRGVTDEAVVDVPSVGQWRAAELDEFTREWLAGCTVVLLYDSDWSEPGKFDVQRQAFAFREYLRRRIGKGRVHVAAPPSPDERDEYGDPVKVGVDDWIGSGGSLGDLVVVERETSPKLRAWCEQWVGDRHDPRAPKSQARLMELMALISLGNDVTPPNRPGRGRSSVKALAGFTSLSRNTVGPAFDALVETGDTFGESPIEWAWRVPPKTGYRGRRIMTTTEDGGPLQDVSVREHQDTLEWVIRDGYRWHERNPRRTLAEVVEHRGHLPAPEPSTLGLRTC